MAQECEPVERDSCAGAKVNERQVHDIIPAICFHFTGIVL